MQIETERDLRIKQLRLIVWVMIALFVVMMTYTIYWLIDYNNKYGNFQKVSAEIVEHKDVEGVTCDVLYYIVDGNEYKITTDKQSSNDVGEIIKIYFDKDNPLSIIYSLDSRRITLLFAGIFGVMCLSLTIVYILINNSNKKLKVITDNTSDN